MEKALKQLIAIICIELIILFPVYTVDALTISNLQVTPKGDSALVTWDTDAESNSTINYGGYNNLDKTSADSSLVTSHSLNLINLESEYTYFYDVISSYYQSPNVFSDTKSGSFKTKDITPPVKITGLTNTSLTQSSVGLAWNESNATDFSMYIIYRNDKNINNISTQTLTQFTDNHLIPSTTYKYETAAMDTSSNIGQKSDSFYITTLEPDLTPPIITNPKIILLTENAASFGWDTDELSNTTIYYGTSTSYGYISAKTESVNNHAIPIQSLVDKTLYYYRLESCDIYGNCNHYDDSFVAGSDIVKPFINITYPLYFNDYKINIIGSTEPYSEVRFYVNNIYRGFIGRDKTGEKGEIDFVLGGFAQGNNTFKVSVKDGAGNFDEQTHNVIIDLNPPQYIMSNISYLTSKESLTINGSTDEPVKIEIYFEKQKTDLTAPEKITNFRNGTITANSAELLWDKSPESDFKTYAIYRDGRLITSYQDNRFIDPGLSTDSSYTYHVSAVDSACNEGLKSEPLTIKTKAGGNAVNPVTSSYNLGCSAAPDIINYTTSFQKTINLQTGLNNIRIILTDLAGNSVEISKQVYFDKGKPSILSENIDELNPSYIMEVAIYGKVDEEATVFIFVNDNRTANQFTSGITNKTLDELKTVSQYEVKTDLNGSFRINIDLRRDPSFAYGTDDQPFTVRTRGKSISYWLNDIKLVAVDKVGLKSDVIEKQIKFALCGSGGDWQINVNNVLPAEIVPRHLLEGFAQVGFNTELEWQGSGNEIDITNANIKVGYPMDMSGEIKDTYDEEWISRVDDRWSNDKKKGYAVINFKKIGVTGNITYEQEKNLSKHNKGECFKAGLGFGGEKIFSEGYIDGAGCVKVPLTIELEYNCEEYEERQDGSYTRWVKVNGSCTQKQCVDIDVMIQPRIPPSVIPKSLLENSIKLINETIDAIDAVLEPLKTATEVALVSCVSLWIVSFVKKASEFFACMGSGSVATLLIGKESSGCYNICEYKDGAIDCGNNNDDKYENCQTCLESKLSTQKVLRLLKWTCDRVMCPSVPSFDKFIEDNDGKDEFCSEYEKEIYYDYEPSGSDMESKEKIIINRQKIYEDIKTGSYEKDPQCKELLDSPLKNQQGGKCCDEYYVQEWDSGCLLMNELKESACLSTRDAGLCGEAWGNIFRGVADFNLCYGNKTDKVETEVDGQWFVLKKGEQFKQVSTNIGSTQAAAEEYDVLDNWELYLGESTRRREIDDKGNVLSESVDVDYNEDNAILSTEDGSKNDKKICEKIMNKQITYEQMGWPTYKKTTDKVIIIKNGKQESETIPPSTITPKIPQSIVNDICSGVGDKEYVVDPTSGVIRGTQCACLSSVYAYLKQYRQVLSIIKTCFQTILVTGDGSAGVCKAVISYYICDLIYYALKCIKEYSGKGYGGEVGAGVGDFIKYVAGSGADISRGVSDRYGNTNLFKVMFVEKKVIHAACLAAFTGDWSIDMETLFDATVQIPIKSTVGIAPATRRFMTYDSITGYATHVYHLGVLMVSGSDNLRYSVELICSADNSCSTADGFVNGVCDCAHSQTGGEQRYGVTGQFGSGSLDSGEVLNEEQYIVVDATSDAYSRLRYDKAKITYTYKDNEDKTQKEEKIVNIRQIGGEPPAECKFDIGTASFKCAFNLGAYKGEAWFGDDSFKSIDSVYLGNSIPFKYSINVNGNYQSGAQKGSLIPKYITAEVKNENGVVVDKLQEKKITSNPFESKEGSYWPLITVKDEHFASTGYTSKMKCEIGSNSGSNFDNAKIASDGICELNLCLKYEGNQWKSYQVNIPGSNNAVADCTSTLASGVTCQVSGKQIECSSSGVTKKTIIYLGSSDASNDNSYIALKGKEATSTSTAQKCTSGEKQKWTATFTLYYPEVDQSGNILSKRGSQVVYYSGARQQKTVSFDVYCSKEGAEVKENKNANVDKDLTKKYSSVISKYISGKGGTSAYWNIDTNGNFICINSNGCSLYDTEDLNYDYFESFHPPGGKINDRDENIKALDNLL